MDHILFMQPKHDCSRMLSTPEIHWGKRVSKLDIWNWWDDFKRRKRGTLQKVATRPKRPLRWWVSGNAQRRYYATVLWSEVWWISWVEVGRLKAWKFWRPVEFVWSRSCRNGHYELPAQQHLVESAPSHGNSGMTATMHAWGRQIKLGCMEGSDKSTQTGKFDNLKAGQRILCNKVSRD